MNQGQKMAIAFIRLYQLVVSPLKTAVFGPWARCRYSPCCSQYAIEALRSHGLAGGLWLALQRLLRCHPFGGMGYDPVPTRPQTGLTCVALEPGQKH